MAAEMIDRFGPLPDATANLVRLIEIKHQAIEANIAKIDVGARGTLVTFHENDFPDGPGLIAYVDRLERRGKIAARHEAGRQPRLGQPGIEAERPVPADQGVERRGPRARRKRPDHAISAANSRRLHRRGLPGTPDRYRTLRAAIRSR